MSNPDVMVPGFTLEGEAETLAAFGLSRRGGQDVTDTLNERFNRGMASYCGICQRIDSQLARISCGYYEPGDCERYGKG